MNLFEPVTHIIFDCDGLLLNTEDIYPLVDAEIISRYGKEYPISLRRKILGTSVKYGASIIIDELKLPITVDEYCSQLKELLTTKLPDAELMPGVEKLVKNLYKVNVPMAIATSGSIESFHLKTSRHKDFFEKYFTHVVAAGSDSKVKNGKPAPDVFLECARRFADSPSPSKCLVLEDAPNGVLGAKRAGMQTVMVPASYIPESEKKLATVCINSLEEFKPEWFGLPLFD